jgi:hypothetical protein
MKSFSEERTNLAQDLDLALLIKDAASCIGVPTYRDSKKVRSKPQDNTQIEDSSRINFSDDVL